MEIDYVVPMVFPEDVLWQRDLERVTGSDAIAHVRWRSWGTERMLIRLVRKNMPWIRTVYVLLARKSQFQYWMNTEGVRVVYHSEFIPKAYRPTFNSCTIEMFLNRIPGLSEYFLYGNDDMFPLSPLKEEDFFVDGRPCQRMYAEEVPKEQNIFQSSCLNGQRFVAGLLGKEVVSWLKNGHSIAPIRKSVCDRLWEAGGKSIEASITPFRERRNFSQYIYSWYQHYSGCYVERSPRRRFVNAGTVESGQIADIIRERPGILCINDNFGVEDYGSKARETREALGEVINQKLP